MSEPEIAEIVDKGWLARIKAGGDPHPLIKAFTVAHEGDSDIRLDGILMPVKWMRRAVGWIRDGLALHTPVFQHHGPPGDNSHQGRTKIGEVVGKALTNIGNKVATVAAMYIYPQHRELPLDVASLEADIQFASEGDSIWPTAINNITGIALASSADGARPGFPDATLIGAVQAFAEGATTVNKTEVKAAVSSLGLAPEDLFTQDQLTGSDAVRQFVIGEKHNLYEHVQRLERERDKRISEIDKLNESHAAEVAKLKQDVMARSGAAVFTKIAAERGLDEQEIGIVNLHLGAFTSTATDEQGLIVDMNKFVDNTLETLAKTREVLGVKTESKAESSTGEAKSKAESSTGKPDKANDGDADANYKTPEGLAPGSVIDEMPAARDGGMDPDVNPLFGGKAAEDFAT